MFRRGNVVSTGVNSGEIHAEVAALKKLWPDQRIGTRVVSLRLTKGGNLGLAKPCASCEAYMRANGVKCVEYSTNDGLIAKMKL